MELKDTIELMKSEDYKDRFKAEYYQTKIRYEKLKRMLNKWDAAKRDNDLQTDPYDKLIKYLGFVPSCSYDLLREQQLLMGQLLHCLEVRSEIEGINFN